MVEERNWEPFDVDQTVGNKIAELLEVGRTHENRTEEKTVVAVAVVVVVWVVG